MDNEVVKIRVNGKIITSIIMTALIVFILTFAIFRYLPDQKRENEINSYKKQIFGSILCQYSCPLVEQTVNNKTQMLPESVCVQQCSGDPENNKQLNAKFSDNDLMKDNLYLDVENIVASCKNTSIEEVNELPSLNNTKLFECVKTGLEGVRVNYDYL